MKNQIRALIVPNLVDVIEDYFGAVEGHRNDPKFLKLAERIQGKEVDLIFTGEDAFEKIDNDYWLPECCWTKV